MRSLRKIALGVGLAIMGMAGSANANIIYSIDISLPSGGGGSVVGTFETDGTIGVLFEPNFIDWNLTITDQEGSFQLTGPLSGGNSNIFPIQSFSLTATLTDLLFDFSIPGFFLIQNPSPGSGINWFCMDFGLACFTAPGVPTINVNTTPASSTVAFLSVGGVVSFANVAAVPEPATLAIFGVGLAGLVFFMRRRRFTT